MIHLINKYSCYCICRWLFFWIIKQMMMWWENLFTESYYTNLNLWNILKGLHFREFFFSILFRFFPFWQMYDIAENLIRLFALDRLYLAWVRKYSVRWMGKGCVDILCVRVFFFWTVSAPGTRLNPQ